MIRADIEKGTSVWNPTFGFGKFEKWGLLREAYVLYPDGCIREISCQLLTEIVE